MSEEPGVLNDEEFLSYCESMAETPRCGFVPQHIARLLRLAGHEEFAVKWDAEPNRIVDCDRVGIRKYVSEARERMKKQ